MHSEESAHHVERLVQVFEIIGKPPRAKPCEAMQGLVSEMDEDMEDFGKTEASDDVLIGCAQAMEHYEMARYGLLKAWAKKLGLADADKLLSETLEEEKKADAMLTQVADQNARAPRKRSPAKREGIRQGCLITLQDPGTLVPGLHCGSGKIQDFRVAGLRRSTVSRVPPSLCQTAVPPT